MSDHNGVLMMQRALLAGTLGLAMARKAADILEGQPKTDRESQPTLDLESQPTSAGATAAEVAAGPAGFRESQGSDAAVLRAILDAANECLGHFDDRPAAERWCDTLFHLLDLAAFATEIAGAAGPGGAGGPDGPPGAHLPDHPGAPGTFRAA